MPISNRSETIDSRILRLIGLEDVFDLDYDTYFSLLKEALVKSNMPGKSIPAEEFELLKDELKRVKSKRNDGRFGVKKKKISTGSFSVSSVKGLIGGTKSKLLPPVSALAKSPMSGGLEGGISEIKEVMVSILETLKVQQKTDKDASDYERRKAEQEKRGLAESKLEKRFEGIKKVAENIIKPVKGLLDKILEFIGTVLLGRIVFKLIEWLGDPKNTDKVKSLIRFFKDNWPKLLSLYIIFGTSFGKFARGLISLVVKGTAALVKATAGLAAKVIGGRVGGRLGKVAGFLGGGRGKLLVAGVEAAATVGGTLALSKGLENFGGIGSENQESKSQNFAGGGYVRPRFAAFSGGGFNFKGMMGGASMGSMFGPLGMLLGGAFGGSSGFVSGEKGVDKVPAMLSDGEIVFSNKAVDYWGADRLLAMNAVGGGTNKPKIMGGTTYAAGGGMIGRVPNAMNALDEVISILDNQIVYNKSQWKKTLSDYKSIGSSQQRLALPAAGESSANAMRAAQRATQGVRKPIPASSAIVPYSGGLVRSGVTGGLSEMPIQQIRTNLNVPTPGSALSRNVRSRPRGYGGALQAAFAAMEFNDRRQSGQTTAQAGLGAAGSALGGQVGWMAGAKAGALLGGAIGSMFGGVGAAPGAAVGAIVGGIAGGFGGSSLGGKLADDLSGVNATKEKLSRGGIGGAIKGGYGLKSQSFEDAPKTQVMTDDKGRPFVGHKAKRNGKLVYVRAPQPGTGTTNPFEAFGRMINPGAYKDNDARLAMKNQKIAMVNALESFQSQNMSPDAQARMMKQMGGNLKDVQNDLNYRKRRARLIAQGKMKPDGTQYNARERMRMSISGSPRKPPNIRPLPKPKPKPAYNPAGGGMNGARGTGGARSSGSQVPSFSARNPRGGTAKAKTLGVRG